MKTINRNNHNFIVHTDAEDVMRPNKKLDIFFVPFTITITACFFVDFFVLLSSIIRILNINYMKFGEYFLFFLSGISQM